MSNQQPSLEECKKVIHNIINNITEMTNFISNNPQFFIRVDNLESKLLEVKHLLHQQFVNLDKDFIQKNK